MRTRLLLLLVFVAAFLSGCDKAKETPAGYYYLPVIETTDIHGHIIERENGAVHYRMAYIADKVRDIRGRGDAYRKDRLLLLDGGDIYQGASVSNMLAGQPVTAAMDVMEYDAVALGNHEFDWGIEQTVDADGTMPDYERGGGRQVNEVPVVCANLYQDGSRAPFTKDYVIVEKTAVNAQGESLRVRIGVIGFAEDYSGSIMTAAFKGRGFSIREDYTIADALAKELEASGRCDATVLLVHGAADRSAEQLGRDSAIDLVLGGHSHETLSGWTGAGTPYLQGGRYCEHYSNADFKFSVDRKTGKPTLAGVVSPFNFAVRAALDQHVSEGQNADDLDEDVLALSDEAIAACNLQGGDVIGYISFGATTYYIKGSGDRATPMSNWMCDILRRIGDADVAFVNSGGVRTSFPLGNQPRRDITVADIYEMFPFNNLTYVYEISYAELLRLFTYSLTNGGRGLFSFMSGIDCGYRDYSVVSLRKDGAVIYQDGRWTDDWATRTLRLAVSEYLATTSRVDNYTGMENPLLQWNGTPRLLSNDLVDNENAVRVLREEAAASGGRLYIDASAHYILQ